MRLYIPQLHTLHSVTGKYRVDDAYNSIRAQWQETEKEADFLFRLDSVQGEMLARNASPPLTKKEKETYLFFTFILTLRYQWKVRKILKLSPQAPRREVLRMLEDFNQYLSKGCTDTSKDQLIEEMKHFSGNLLYELSFSYSNLLASWLVKVALCILVIDLFVSVLPAILVLFLTLGIGMILIGQAYDKPKTRDLTSSEKGYFGLQGSYGIKVQDTFSISKFSFFVPKKEIETCARYFPRYRSPSLAGSDDSDA